MPKVVFVAPFFMETTLRFVDAVASLPEVELQTRSLEWTSPQTVVLRIEGLVHLMAELRKHVVMLDLLPIGAPRRDWKQTLISDGMIIARHPDLQKTLEIADRFGTELRMYAG